MELNILIETDENQRLDKYLAAKLEWMTRTQIKALIEDGFILVNGRIVKASYPVKRGDLVEVTVPDPEDSWLEPENIPLDVYYEDSDLLVINKPAGMVVHPAAGNRSGTLVNALLHHCKDLSGIGGIHRPGIVHRLDKGTSGLLVACKNDFAHRSLSKSFARRQVTRKYHAVVHGLIPHNYGRIEAPIGRSPQDRKLMAVMEGGGTRRLISACLSVFPNTVIWNSPWRRGERTKSESTCNTSAIQSSATRNTAEKKTRCGRCSCTRRRSGSIIPGRANIWNGARPYRIISKHISINSEKKTASSCLFV